MAYTDINGIGIAYDLIGDEGLPAVVITPGGRFPRDMPSAFECD
jgi:hypothetical protein